MTRSLLPLALLVLLVSACSSTQSTLNTEPVPAKSKGVVQTRWGAMPAYTCDQGSPVIFNPLGIFPPAQGYSVEVDLLFDRDGTVRDVALRRTSGTPDMDAALTAKFKAARSRLVLPPGDPAPYVIQYSIKHVVDLSDPPNYNRDQYHFTNDRPMGTGQPIAGDRSY